jgi:hypothetical protein
MRNLFPADPPLPETEEKYVKAFGVLDVSFHYSEKVGSVASPRFDIFYRLLRFRLRTRLSPFSNNL